MISEFKAKMFFEIISRKAEALLRTEGVDLNELVRSLKVIRSELKSEKDDSSILLRIHNLIQFLEDTPAKNLIHPPDRLVSEDLADHRQKQREGFDAFAAINIDQTDTIFRKTLEGQIVSLLELFENKQGMDRKEALKTANFYILMKLGDMLYPAEFQYIENDGKYFWKVNVVHRKTKKIRGELTIPVTGEKRVIWQPAEQS